MRDGEEERREKREERRGEHQKDAGPPFVFTPRTTTGSESVSGWWACVRDAPWKAPIAVGGGLMDSSRQRENNRARPYDALIVFFVALFPSPPSFPSLVCLPIEATMRWMDRWLARLTVPRTLFLTQAC